MSNIEEPEVIPVIPEEQLEDFYARDPKGVQELLSDPDERRAVAQEIIDGPEVTTEDLTTDEGEEKETLEHEETLSPELEEAFEKYRGKNGLYFGKYKTITAALDSVPHMQGLLRKKAEELQPEEISEVVPDIERPIQKKEDHSNVTVPENEMVGLQGWVATTLQSDPQIVRYLDKLGIEFPSTEAQLSEIEDLADDNLLAEKLYSRITSEAKRLFNAGLNELKSRHSIADKKDAIAGERAQASIDRLYEETGFMDAELVKTRINELYDEHADDPMYFETKHGVSVLRENAIYDYMLSKDRKVIFDHLRSTGKQEGVSEIQQMYETRSQKAGTPNKGLAMMSGGRTNQFQGDIPDPEVLNSEEATEMWSAEEMAKIRARIKALPDNNPIKRRHIEFIRQKHGA